LVYIFRRLLRAHSFSLVVIATVALAIGINCGLLSVTRSILFRSLGVPDADRLLYYTLGNGSDAIPFSGPAYEALRAKAVSKEFAIWNSSIDLILQNDEGAKRVSGALVNGSFFAVMKLTPTLGRFFSEDDDRPGGGSSGWSVVLGYDYWKSQYNGSPLVIGTVLHINGVPVQIVGVLPKGFTGMTPPMTTEMLLPRRFLSILSPKQDRFSFVGDMEWNVFSRLPQGSTREAVEANLHVIDANVLNAADPTRTIFTAENFPTMAYGHLISVSSGQLGATNGLKAIRMPLFAMEALGLLLFLLCTCNLILLFAGRIARQSNETAIRLALGASRNKLFHVDVLEAIVLATIGSVVAIPLAWGMAHALSLIIQSTDGFNSFPTVDPTLPFLFMASGVAIVISIISAFAASHWQSKRSPTLRLGTGNRLITSLPNPWTVGIEIFVAILLISVAAAGVAGFETFVHEPSGLGTDNVATASLTDIGDDAADTNQKVTRILERIASAPGVQSVATMNITPLTGETTRATFSARLSSGARPARAGMWPEEVSLNYFSAAGTKVVRGRDFVSEDLAGEPVCLISAKAATALFNSENSIGNLIYSGESGRLSQSTKAYCRVIGVTEDVHLESMTALPNEAIYKLTRNLMPNIIVRASSGQLAIQAVRNAVHSVAPLNLTSNLGSIQTHIDDDLRIIRLLTIFAALCASTTACIMAICIFGVLALEISARKRDIGIQIALGADKFSICKAVIRRFSKAVGLGFGFGSVLAILIIRRLTEQYAVSPQDGILAYTAGSLIVLLIVLIAACIPLQRAISISPLECLRAEN
jgi:putative ABC transport system permease protein